MPLNESAVFFTTDPLPLHLQELYSADAHFVLELVQNADDNAYAAGVTPGLEFEVLDDEVRSVDWLWIYKTCLSWFIYRPVYLKAWIWTAC